MRIADVSPQPEPLSPDCTDAPAAVDATESLESSAPEKPTSRRALFAAGVAALAVAASPRNARAQGIGLPKPRKPERISVIPDETPVAPDEWASDTTRLLRRITYGLTDADVATAKQYGFRGYLERQLDYTRLDDSATEAFVTANYANLTATLAELAIRDAGITQRHLQQGTLYRAAFSTRQLYERMVEFWSDHFNISIQKVTYLKAIDDRDVIRKHALGNFRDLLYASAKSAAMMSYLDQNQSRNTAPNQNYARELMELHTLGVDGGYTQTDVAELSRVLTGWTVAGRGDFAFSPNIHDWGAKTVLGVTIPAGSPSLGAAGIKEGEQMLDLLLAHPSTAKFISKKMLQWFVTYDPTQAQIDAVAAVYTKTKGDIKSMVRATLNTKWLAAAPMKLKRPFHLLVSQLRATAPTVTSVNNLNNQLVNLGQQLFLWETPDGYPDMVEYWSGAVMSRWNVASYVSTLSAGETIVDTTPFMRTPTADYTVAMIDTKFFAGEMDTKLRTSLTTYLKAGAYNAARVRETMALAMSSNSFQWY